MIYPELRGYLEGAVSTEDLVQFDAGFALLEAFEVDDYMTPFETIVGEVSRYGDTSTVDNLRVTLQGLLASLLQMHTLVLNPDSDLHLSTYVAFGTALLEVANYQDSDTLVRTVVEGQGVNHNNEEIFCDVAAIVLGQPTEDFLPHVFSVGDGLIEGLKSLGQDEDEQAGEAFEQQVRSFLADYRKLRDKTVEPTLWADLALRSPGMFGIPFEFHLKRFLIERHSLVADCVTTEQYAQLAHELVALAAISQERLANALAVIRQYAGELFTDLNQTTLLDQAVAKFFMEVNRVAT